VSSLRTQIQIEVNRLSHLPTLSPVLALVVSMLEQDSSSTRQLAAVIEKDQALCARILRLVNSPFYGFPHRIASVSHAITLLGFNVVKGLVLSSEAFTGLGADRGLWEHSLGTALFSKKIAQVLSMPDYEELMVAGLLHDLGKLILTVLHPEQYASAVTAARNQSCTIREAESAVFGIDHVEVVALTVQAWHLPSRLMDAIVHHHTPFAAPRSRSGASVVHLADALARLMGYGDPGDNTMPEFHPDVLLHLWIHLSQLDSLLPEVENLYQSGRTFLNGRSH
jgi:putative nucleotidyltransferase with HDIG domain